MKISHLASQLCPKEWIFTWWKYLVTQYSTFSNCGGRVMSCIKKLYIIEWKLFGSKEDQFWQVQLQSHLKSKWIGAPGNHGHEFSTCGVGGACQVNILLYNRNNVQWARWIFLISIVGKNMKFLMNAHTK